MRVMSLGHAGLMIETAAGRTVVCDPWLSERGAFLAGWFQLPQNDHLKQRIIDRGIDVLYVSHGHLDHFDMDTLRDLPRDLTLVVASFPSRPWVEQVRALGFRDVHFLDGEKTVEAAPGVTVQVITEDSAYFADSALIVEADGQVVVNLNDCHISEPQAQAIKARYPHISTVFAQFSGANWYPFVYDFPEPVRVAAARAKVENSLQRWKRYMDGLQPDFAVPFAGPPCMLDPDTRRYLDASDSIFPTPLDLVDWLRERDPSLAGRTLPLLPGDWIDVATGAVERDEAMHASFAWDRLGEYVEAYAERKADILRREVASYAWPRESLYPAFRSYFIDMLEAGPRLATRVDARVLFDIEGAGGGRWLVDFRALEVSDVSDDTRPYAELCDYAFRLESRYLVPILDGRNGWSDVFLSFRFHAWRPDVASYNEPLMTFLRFYKREDLRVREQMLAKLMAEKEQGVQRFCPHTGERLDAACYDPALNAIVCPRHGWTFDVPSGACRNGNANLRIEPRTTAPTGG